MKLIIGNSISKLEELTDKQVKLVKEALSYTDGNFFGGGNRFAKKCLINRRGEFPSGLLSRVQELFKNEQYVTLDTRKRPQPQGKLFNLSPQVTPYPAQQNAVAACIKRLGGICSMPTGSGKSITMALLINSLQLKTLIVVPNLELKRQLTSSFKSLFGSLDNITIENIDSSKLDKATNYDVLILDEAHHAAAKTYRKLNVKAWKNIYHRFSFTATPFRSKDEETLLFNSICGDVIYELGYKEAVESGYIVPVEAYYVELPKQQMKGNPLSWHSVNSELCILNNHRNQAVLNLMAAFYPSPTLVLVKEIKHGNILSLSSEVPFANGEAENTRQLILEFCLGEHKTLIGTSGVIGEGVDTKPAEFVILAGGGKSKNQFMQQVGRVLRVYPGKETGKVILFKDSSHKWLLAHYKACVKILKDEYGIIPVKLEI